jgi:hypothetical protein
MANSTGFGEVLVRIHAAINQSLNAQSAGSTEECIPANNDYLTAGNTGKSPKARRSRFSSHAYLVAFALILVVLVAGGVHAENQITANLSEAQAQQIHQAVCSEPVSKVKQDRLDIWVCAHPRDYPGQTSPSLCPVNTLNFTSGHDGRFDIFFGRFTADRPQAIAMYEAACEPHANSFGGMALFNIVGQKFELVRYFPGLRPVNCVVAPPQGDGRQTAYCFSSFMAQGILGQSFGPIRFKRSGEAAFDAWFGAGNSDGHHGVLTGCKTKNPNPHHISAIRLDEAKSEILLDVVVLDPRSVASACDRFRKGDFDDTERDLQESYASVRGMAFIRPDEFNFVTMVVRFRPPSAKPKVEPTSKTTEP